jgi:hypothetical protein
MHLYLFIISCLNYLKSKLFKLNPRLLKEFIQGRFEDAQPKLYNTLYQYYAKSNRLILSVKQQHSVMYSLKTEIKSKLEEIIGFSFPFLLRFNQYNKLCTV